MLFNQLSGQYQRIVKNTTHFVACVLSLLTFMIAPAYADDIQDVAKLVKAGQLDQALQRADSFLAAKPKDAQMRFLKGLILTEQGKAPDAIGVFQRLSEDYPELPEPYNNLAVLFASQGQYDKARAALEMAIRTHPSYAIAYENLGDIYSKLASQSYDKALQLDSSNSTAQTKLSLIRDLIGSNTRKPSLASPVASSAATPTVAKPVSAPPSMVLSKPNDSAKTTPVTAVSTVPTTPIAPIASAANSATPIATSAVTPPVVNNATASKTPEASKAQTQPLSTSAQTARSNDEAAVTAAVQNWARAWSNKNVAAYLDSYADNFEPPKGMSRKQWEEERRTRIAGKAKISVSIDNLHISINKNEAVAKFHQGYRSGRLVTTTRKVLTLVKVGGKWLIKQERVGA